MAAFVEFLGSVLSKGSAVLRERPEVSAKDREPAVRLLETAYADYRLQVAGPPVAFDRGAALAAAEWLWWGCWYLVDRRETPEEVVRTLPEPFAPATVGQHLSADLSLRHLPQVLRRARAAAGADVLPEWLERVLRRWPLSGVLADVGGGPEAAERSLDFGGHPGLQLLYAERLADNPRQDWMPGGAARGVVELVFAQRGLALPHGVGEGGR